MADIFNEKTTGYVNLSFKDEDGNAVVPDSATYTLYNEANAEIINGREDTEISGVTNDFDLELTPDDNIIVRNNEIRETHVLMIEWTYNTDKKGKDEYRFAVENLTKVG